MSIMRSLGKGYRLPRYTAERHVRWCSEITEYIHCVAPLGGQIIEGEIPDPRPAATEPQPLDAAAKGDRRSSRGYTLDMSRLGEDDEETESDDEAAGDALPDDLVTQVYERLSMMPLTPPEGVAPATVTSGPPLSPVATRPAGTAQTDSQTRPSRRSLMYGISAH